MKAQEKFIRIAYNQNGRVVARYFSALTIAVEKINKEFGEDTLNYLTVRKKKFPFTHNGFRVSKILIERRK